MQILLLPRYGSDAASSRQRFYQYVPDLKSAGFDCAVVPFFEDGYLTSRFSQRQEMPSSVLSSYWRRLQVLKDRGEVDVLFVQMEAFPYLPFILEYRLLPKNIPIVCDYDDAWFHRYDQHSNLPVRLLLSHKIARIIERSSEVIVGSTYLAEYARQFNGHVHLIPTCIDLARYPTLPPRPDSDSPFTIGWIGSPSTTPFLRKVVGPLMQFCSSHRARVVLIGASQEPLGISNLTRLPWAEETEVENMAHFDVGIMPLPDSPFARGKCAFKLIQYMGCWKPIIASPVGENVRVAEDGVNGFLADTDEEWLKALEQLFSDTDLRHAMGRAGREKVEREYSLRVHAPQIIQILQRAAGARI